MATFTPNKHSKPAFSAEELARLQAMTPEQRDAAAEADPDARPLSAEQLKKAAMARRVQALRKRIMATQPEFAALYHIPLGTLRDLEQARTKSDAITTAFIALIEADPEHAAKVLAEVED